MEGNNSIKKGVVVAVILLFVSVSVIPSTGNRVSFDDITPPVTTCTLNPPEPNGENGWYISDVEVTLNATDDMSGVNRTEYRINFGSIKTYTEPFNASQDGDLMIEYRSIDYAGNVEDWKSVEFWIDQKLPIVDIYYHVSGVNDIIFTAECRDDISGMDRVEFYQDDELMCTDDEMPYEWLILGDNKKSVFGLIFNPRFSEQNVTFFALLVLIGMYVPVDTASRFFATAYDFAGNSETDELLGSIHIDSSILMFEHLIFPNNYDGYIGRFFIRATFDYE